MNEDTILQFTSKECKNKVHSKCHSSWTGLGFNIICRCICHGHRSAVSIIKNKTSTRLSIGNGEKKALEQQVVEPACSNTSDQDRPSQQHEMPSDV